MKGLSESKNQVNVEACTNPNVSAINVMSTFTGQAPTGFLLLDGCSLHYSAVITHYAKEHAGSFFYYNCPILLLSPHYWNPIGNMYAMIFLLILCITTLQFPYCHAFLFFIQHVSVLYAYNTFPWRNVIYCILCDWDVYSASVL